MSDNWPELRDHQSPCPGLPPQVLVTNEGPCLAPLQTKQNWLRPALYSDPTTRFS